MGRVLVSPSFAQVPFSAPSSIQVGAFTCCQSVYSCSWAQAAKARAEVAHIVMPAIANISFLFFISLLLKKIP